MGRDILRKIEGRELPAEKPEAFTSGRRWTIHSEDADKIKRITDEKDLREAIYHSNKNALYESKGLDEFYKPTNLTFNEYEKLRGMKGEERYDKAKELILEREKDIRKDFDKLPELRDVFIHDGEIPNDILMRLTPRELEDFYKLKNDLRSIPELHDYLKDVYERRNEVSDHEALR